MRFISNGDYLLPLELPSYWAQHVYMWSFERGAANPDGIMRLPGRLIDILVFGLFGNLGVGYFYLLSCLIIAFLCFYWFSRSFLGVARWGTAVLGSLFFMLNPIFLGNLSKVGLILAVSMLPLALVSVKQGFATKRFSYFLLFILALNVSLLHPFTFTVNLLVSGGYAVYLIHKRWTFVSDNRWKFILLGVVAILLNAYLILPLASMRTLDKGALSDQVGSQPTDYTGLVDIANTGDIFTGLSLSKGVLKDYEFYGVTTWPFYFLGVFLFYILLFSVYVKVEKRTSPHERRRFLLAIGIFLGLVVLATAGYLYADVFIKFLIGLPGGWMFRSPLKWQLYMPLALFAALVIALKYVHDGWRLKLLYAAFGLSFLLMNGYLFTQVHARLLTPRNITYFSGLAETDMGGKNLLVADSGLCAKIAQVNPAIATELNQILVSKSAQIKHAQAAMLHKVNLGQYDYVLGCAGTMDEQLLTKQFAFERADTFVSEAYWLYKNTQPTTFVTAEPGAILLERTENLGAKHTFVTEKLDMPFVFTSDENAKNARGLQDIFEGFSPANISQGSLQAEIKPTTPGQQLLYGMDSGRVYTNEEAGKVNLTTSAKSNATELGTTPLEIDITGGQTLRVTYTDPRFSYQNIMQNPSFEEGLWQKEVSDCNNYDDKPNISIKHASTATDGDKSLQLGAKAHIACTYAPSTAVQAGQKYLLSFDYKTNGGRFAGYHAGFDDPAASSTSARLDDTKGDWKNFSDIVTIPYDAANLKLILYAYPATQVGKAGVATYDNVKLIQVPDIFGHFFLVGPSDQPPQTSAPRIDYVMSNPTKTVITVRGARGPFYVNTKETFHALWQLKAGETVVGDHLKLNGNMNGWWVDPAIVCQIHACTKNSDGSYDFALAMNFAPQQWFYKGLLISGATLVGVVGYIAFDFWRARRERKVR